MLLNRKLIAVFYASPLVLSLSPFIQHQYRTRRTIPLPLAQPIYLLRLTLPKPIPMSHGKCSIISILV